MRQSAIDKAIATLEQERTVIDLAILRLKAAAEPTRKPRIVKVRPAPQSIEK